MFFSSFALILAPKLKIAFKCSLKLFKQPGTVDKVSPSESGTPQHGKPWNIPWVPGPPVGELLNPSQPCTGLCPSAFQLLVWVFSLGSSPAFTLWSPQMVLASSGLALMGLTVLGFALALSVPPVSSRCPALAWPQDGNPQRWTA